MSGLGHVETESVGVVGFSDLFWPDDGLLDSHALEIQFVGYSAGDELAVI